MKKVEDCIFCKIVAKGIPSKIVFEDENSIAFLDIFPITPGHTIIIPKEHFSNLEDISDDALMKLITTTKLIVKKIRKVLDVEGYNLIQNNFEAAGQEINHFHIHIIPRSINDNKISLNIPKVQADDKGLEKIQNLLKD